jgi:hypothetical protein
MPFNITKVFGHEVPVVLKAFQYGFEHPSFSREDIQRATGLDEATWRRYWQNMRMVVELGDNTFCLTTEATGIYLQLLSYQHAERQARIATVLSAVAIVISIVLAVFLHK